MVGGLTSLLVIGDRVGDNDGRRVVTDAVGANVGEVVISDVFVGDGVPNVGDDDGCCTGPDVVGEGIIADAVVGDCVPRGGDDDGCSVGFVVIPDVVGERVTRIPGDPRLLSLPLSGMNQRDKNKANTTTQHTNSRVKRCAGDTPSSVFSSPPWFGECLVGVSVAVKSGKCCAVSHGCSIACLGCRGDDERASNPRRSTRGGDCGSICSVTSDLGKLLVSLKIP